MGTFDLFIPFQLKVNISSLFPPHPPLLFSNVTNTDDENCWILTGNLIPRHRVHRVKWQKRRVITGGRWGLGGHLPEQRTHHCLLNSTGCFFAAVVRGFDAKVETSRGNVASLQMVLVSVDPAGRFQTAVTYYAAEGCLDSIHFT